MVTAFNKYQGTGNDFIIIDNRNLSVDLRIDGDRVTDIWLRGPATFVFEGTIEA